MAARSYVGVQNAAREARRILGMAEPSSLWDGAVPRRGLTGGDPLQRRAPAHRGGSALGRAPALPGATPAEETLIAIADRLGSERGSHRHRMAEVYHMMFRHLRDSAPAVMELVQGPAPLRGQAAHGALWAEYFRQAQVMVLATEPAPEGWAVDGASWHLADPDTRPRLAQTLHDLPAPSIVIDDGSHASHHQQNAFLELFPRLAQGGFYVIEGLRGQPEALERPGITRSADLFRGFAEKRCFAHSDPGTEAAFAELAPQISGVLMLQAGFDRNRRDFAAVIQKR